MSFGILVRWSGEHLALDGVRCVSRSRELRSARRVTIWDTESYSCLQKYPAELMTSENKSHAFGGPRCGSDLSAMGAFHVASVNMSLLVLAVGRLNCVSCLSVRGWMAHYAYGASRGGKTGRASKLLVKSL